MLVVTQRLYEAPRVCDSSVPLDVLVELGTAYLALQSVSTKLGLDDLENIDPTTNCHVTSLAQVRTSGIPQTKCYSFYLPM